MRMKVAALVLIVAVVATADLRAEGDGIGGVLTRDVPIDTDEDEWPTILPAGGLVAFGYGSDWSATNRKDGRIQVHFIISEENGDRDGGHAWIPEDAVRTFSWACGEPQKKIGSRGSILCSPYVTTGLWASSSQWNLRFVTVARDAARAEGLQLVEEFSPAYKGSESSPLPGPAAVGAESCTVQQILRMQEIGLTETQIKAACGG
jgi:hypothetical protein